MKPLIWALPLLSALAGCVHSQASPQLVAAYAECRGLPGSMTEKVSCMNRAENTYARRNSSGDLLDALQSKRLALAMKVDRREMRQEDADSEFDTFKVSIMSEQQRRDAAASAQAGDALIGFGAALMAMNPPAPTPAMAPIIRPPVQCNTVYHRGGTASTTCY